MERRKDVGRRKHDMSSFWRRRSLLAGVGMVLAGFALSAALNVLFLTGTIEKACAARLSLADFQRFQLLNATLNLIKTLYIEGDRISTEKLIYGALNGMVKALDDPYSRFLEPKKFRRMKTNTEGSFGGLGIVIGERDGHITIIAPIRGTPAYRAGIKKGDIIVKVEGESIEDRALEDVVDILRGPIGTKVTITVYRKDERRFLDFTITREKIELPTIKYIYDEKSAIGYVQLSSFMETTGSTLGGIVRSMQKRGMKGLVLDLRGNPGGVLTAAVKVAQLFLDEGTIVTVRSSEKAAAYMGAPRERVYTVGTVRRMFRLASDMRNDYPLFVLVDEGSASASEIVAGAIKDNRRGLLLGRKTFGKGSVQQVLPLDPTGNGPALVLTIAHYYTPSGKCIHKIGIEPDVEIRQKPISRKDAMRFRKAMDEAYEHSMKKGAVESGSAQHITSEEFDIMKRYDYQLQTALDLLKGTIIFGQRAIATEASGDSKGR